MAIALTGLVAYAALRNREQAHPPPAPPAATPGIIGIPAGAVVIDTRHYRIHSTASANHAADVGQALEELRAAYAGLFPIPEATSKFAVVLYRDRAEFSRHNRSSPWAEAFYLDRACYAYFEAGARNPYHWAMHEAVHQLAREGSGFRRNRWMEEGLASYFSASQRAVSAPGLVNPNSVGPRPTAATGDSNAVAIGKNRDAMTLALLDQLRARFICARRASGRP